MNRLLLTMIIIGSAALCTACSDNTATKEEVTETTTTESVVTDESATVSETTETTETETLAPGEIPPAPIFPERDIEKEVHIQL